MYYFFQFDANVNGVIFWQIYQNIFPFITDGLDCLAPRVVVYDQIWSHRSWFQIRRIFLFISMKIILSHNVARKASICLHWKRCLVAHLRITWVFLLGTKGTFFKYNQSSPPWEFMRKIVAGIILCKTYIVYLLCICYLFYLGVHGVKEPKRNLQTEQLD